MGRNKKLNDFAYVLDEQGRIDYILVDIWSPKYGLFQTKIELEHENLLKDGALIVRKDRDDFRVIQRVNGKCENFYRRMFPDIKPNEQVDHKFGDTLDNRLRNLEKATHRQNNRNTYKHRNGHLFGTYFDESRNKWQAYTYINKKRHQLGRFPTQEEAHQAVLEFELSNEHLFNPDDQQS